MASALRPGDLLLPARDSDCQVLLQMPNVARKRLEKHDQLGNGSPAKRCKGGDGNGGGGSRATGNEQQPGEQQGEAQVQVVQVVALEASSQLLKCASEKFQAAMERWSEPGAAKQLVLECRCEEDVQTYRHLLAFVHSLGRELPQEPEAVLRLLLLAREHAVEPAVAACLKHLLGQARRLSAAVCFKALHELETGCSAHSSVQKAARELADACCRRLGAAFERETVSGDKELQAALLRYLGPLQQMLNNRQRRQLFVRMPLAVVRDFILDDANVAADTEATVLAAAALWMEYYSPRYQAHHAQGGNRNLLNAAARELCSRIRFPTIPPHVLLNHHAVNKLLGAFDEDRRWTMHAITAAADPVAAAGWRKFAAQMAAGNGEGGGAGIETARRVYSMVERWWTERPAPLQPLPAPATFEFELQQPADNNHSLSDDLAYWGGYFWHARMDRELGDALAVVIFPTVAMDPHKAPDQDKPGVMLPCAWVKLQIGLMDYDTGKYVDQLEAPVCAEVYPSAALGYTTWRPVDSSSRRWRWRPFWDTDESPFLHSMVTARVRVQLNMATPAEIGAA